MARYGQAMKPREPGRLLPPGSVALEGSRVTLSFRWEPSRVGEERPAVQARWRAGLDSRGGAAGGDRDRGDGRGAVQRLVPGARVVSERVGGLAK